MNGEKAEAAREDPWRIVERARVQKRPSALDFVGWISDSYLELHGDRCFGDDPAVVGGLALADGVAFTFVGTQKGRNMKEAIQRNFGMANPEGYRKALRLARQAEIFDRPVVTFINTPGAFPGLEAEERGIGESLAVSIREFSLLRVPIIAFFIGEGWSGGALAIGVADELYMLENTAYSVITPEGCASILMRDSSKSHEAATNLRVNPDFLVEHGIADGIIAEPKEGIQSAPETVAAEIKRLMLEGIARSRAKSPEQLVKDRIKRYREMGEYLESGSQRGALRRFLGKR